MSKPDEVAMNQAKSCGVKGYAQQKATTRIVTCPACGGESVYGPDNAARPFCSTRCKEIDLGAWASESFRVPTAPTPDELLLDESHLQ